MLGTAIDVHGQEKFRNVNAVEDTRSSTTISKRSHIWKSDGLLAKRKSRFNLQGFSNGVTHTIIYTINVPHMHQTLRPLAWQMK